jgi:Response regulator receiver domain/Adenylate and Guanylate cyclase catalytic domain
MDGITALRLIKDDPQTRLVPVVLMTALNSVEARVRGIEAGADDFLSKPVDERELLARIRTALSHKRAVEATVDELAITSAHLERYGRRMGEVAVAAARWRLREAAGPAEAVGFVARRHRAGAQQRLREHGGVPSEGDADVLVAAFDRSDERSRTLAAVEAALAVVASDADGVAVSVGISAGGAEIGSRQVSSGGEPRWRYGVEGEPVKRASRLAHEAIERGVWLTGTAAAAIGDRFRLQPTGADAYRIVGRARLPHVQRRIRTILMTDIVGSTRLAERLGDRAWAELLAAHEQATRTELTRFGGEEINTMGDGFLAAFDSSRRRFAAPAARWSPSSRSASGCARVSTPARWSICMVAPVGSR